MSDKCSGLGAGCSFQEGVDDALGVLGLDWPALSKSPRLSAEPMHNPGQSRERARERCGRAWVGVG